MMKENHLRREKFFSDFLSLDITRRGLHEGIFNAIIIKVMGQKGLSYGIFSGFCK
jgi:hypothetical protein